LQTSQWQQITDLLSNNSTAQFINSLLSQFLTSYKYMPKLWHCIYFIKHYTVLFNKLRGTSDRELYYICTFSSCIAKYFVYNKYSTTLIYSHFIFTGLLFTIWTVFGNNQQLTGNIKSFSDYLSYIEIINGNNSIILKISVDRVSHHVSHIPEYKYLHIHCHETLK
jgi:hypothetical protein